MYQLSNSSLHWKSSRWCRLPVSSLFEKKYVVKEAVIFWVQFRITTFQFVTHKIFLIPRLFELWILIQKLEMLPDGLPLISSWKLSMLLQYISTIAIVYFFSIQFYIKLYKKVISLSSICVWSSIVYIKWYHFGD